MKKARIAKFVGIAASIPVLLLTTTGSAFADGTVTWTDSATSGCLAYDSNGNGGFNVESHVPDVNDGWQCSWSNGSDDHWVDSQNNLQNPNGAWAEHPANNQSFCLTSYWAGSNGVGSVYLEPCSSPANWYEQWYEQNINGKWRLVNRETGMCLDSGNDADGNGRGNVYAMACNGGNYQYWH